MRFAHHPARQLVEQVRVDARRREGDHHGLQVVEVAELEADLALVVIGQQGWGDVDLRAPHVTLLGKVSDERLASVLAGASVLAAPSLAEGFGLPVLEAMAAGVPVVHSDDPALVEVAGGAGTVVRRGDLASLTEGLRAVLADPRHTVEAGITRASEFTWEKTAQGVWDTHT